MVALLDVNVLVALFDPAHVHHDAAHAWFGEHCAQGWATCALTENGLVRVLSNPAYPGRRTSLDAYARIKRAREQEGLTLDENSRAPLMLSSSNAYGTRLSTITGITRGAAFCW